MSYLLTKSHILSCLGLNLQVAQKSDEVDILREEVARDLRSALSNIKLQERGVYVQASTLGSLEALLEFLRTSKIPVSTHFIFQTVLFVAFPVQLLSHVFMLFLHKFVELRA